MNKNILLFLLLIAIISCTPTQFDDGKPEPVQYQKQVEVRELPIPEETKSESTITEKTSKLSVTYIIDGDTVNLKGCARKVKGVPLKYRPLIYAGSFF